MRLWLKDSERKSDPPAVTTDDRTAVLIGTAVWLAALIAVIVALPALQQSGHHWWLWTCIVGLALGLAGLVVLSRRH